MAKSRTRFVIKANNQVSELFGVVELASGDLSIIPKHAERAQRDGEQAHEITKYRTSVHVSPSSDGPTIVRHVSTAGGLYERLYANVSRTETPLLWPVMAMLSQDRFRYRYACKPKVRDKVISLGTYCPLTSALAYVVILTDRGCDKPPAPGFLNHTFAEFSRFALHVFWGFIPMPSTNQGRGIYPQTGLLVEQGRQKTEDLLLPALKSRTPAQLQSWVKDTLIALIVHQTSFLIALYAETDRPLLEAELVNLGKIVAEPLPPPPIATLEKWGVSIKVLPDEESDLATTP